MNKLAIKILAYIHNAGQTDSDNVIATFASDNTKEILMAIEMLCGAKATSGYILYHKTSRSDKPAYDLLKILPKGEEFLDS